MWTMRGSPNPVYIATDGHEAVPMPVRVGETAVTREAA
jgi:hypothetical protein